MQPLQNHQTKTGFYKKLLNKHRNQSEVSIENISYIKNASNEGDDINSEKIDYFDNRSNSSKNLYAPKFITPQY
jgi:transposase-like protein